MDDRMRFVTTVAIWSAFVIIMGIIAGTLIALNVVFDEIAGGIVLALFVVLAVAVTSSTQAIWQSGSRSQPGEIPVAKAKRRQQDRISRLVDSLDEDDIYELEALLIAREQDETARHRQ